MYNRVETDKAEQGLNGCGNSRENGQSRPKQLIGQWEDRKSLVRCDQ